MMIFIVWYTLKCLNGQVKAFESALLDAWLVGGVTLSHTYKVQ